MLELKNVSLSYGGNQVLHECSLSLSPGEHIALMGPSGCGKTSLLRIIAGLLKPDSGTVHADGKISFVFQELRLLPWLTARENISVVLPGGSGDTAEADLLLSEAGLADFAGSFPSQLSGGMCQRVSICRALAAGGDIFLLDEPLKGLDSELKKQIAQLIRSRTEGKILIVVTHDAEEASLLADTVYLKRGGGFVRE